MKFNESDRADASQVDDRRGAGAAIGAGAGGLGLVGALIYLALQWLGGPSVDIADQTTTTGANGNGPGQPIVSKSCEGVTSSSDRGEFIACVQNNVQAFWKEELPVMGPRYDSAKLVLFEDATQSGCGLARADTGPFYCPDDHEVYLDLGFFDELHRRFHARGGDFAEAYVVAHEYGHHVQWLTGTEREFARAIQKDPSARNALSVKLELQADCYAGVWGHHAYEQGKVSHEEIAQALDAAASVGDDRIQAAATGHIRPEKFTHGSAQERQTWFERGMDSGDPMQCDTFGGAVK